MGQQIKDDKIKEYVCGNCGWKGSKYINPPYSDIWFQSFPLGIFAAGLAGEKARGVCPNCKKKTIQVDMNTAADNISPLPKFLSIILIIGAILLACYELILTF